jgi:methionyl aminopeptidase
VGIICKSRREIERIREAGRIVATVLSEIERAVEPGVTTAEFRRIAEDVIARNEGEPVFQSEAGFPSPICTSINDEVVHGIPSLQKLKEGDIVSVDVGVRKRGYIGDAAKTFAVGTIGEEDERLLRITRECLDRAIAVLRPGADLVDVCRAVQDHAEANGFSVVREFVGHGVGEKLHEAPQVPNYVGSGGGKPGTVLRPGMVLAIEPMVNVGTYKVKKLSDGWTVVTRDGKRSAHFEHTVAVVDEGSEILTLP